MKSLSLVALAVSAILLLTGSFIEAYSTNPCATVFCAKGTRCEVQVINCFTTPCPPQVECVPINGTKYGGGNTNKGAPTKREVLDYNPNDDPCSRVRCRGDSECIVVPGNCNGEGPCHQVAKCVPKNVTNA